MLACPLQLALRLLGEPLDKLVNCCSPAERLMRSRIEGADFSQFPQRAQSVRRITSQRVVKHRDEQCFLLGDLVLLPIDG